MRKWAMIAGGVAVVGVAAAALLWTNLGRIICAAVERFGSDATQTDVSLDGADFSLTEGTGALKGFVVGSPKGFECPCSIRVDRVAVSLDPSSVGSEKVVVREVVIEGPQVTYELDGSLSSNIGRIQDNVAAYAKRFGGDGGASEAGSGDGGAGGGETKYVIEHLRIRGGRLALAASITKGKDLVAVALPEVHVEGIGRGTGATAAAVTVVILDAITRSALEAAPKALAENGAKGLLDKAGDAVKGLLGR